MTPVTDVTALHKGDQLILAYDLGHHSVKAEAEVVSQAPLWWGEGAILRITKILYKGYRSSRYVDEVVFARPSDIYRTD